MMEDLEVSQYVMIEDGDEQIIVKRDLLLSILVFLGVLAAADLKQS